MKERRRTAPAHLSGDEAFQLSQVKHIYDFPSQTATRRHTSTATATTTVLPAIGGASRKAHISKLSKPKPPSTYGGGAAAAPRWEVSLRNGKYTSSPQPRTTSRRRTEHKPEPAQEEAATALLLPAVIGTTTAPSPPDDDAAPTPANYIRYSTVSNRGLEAAAAAASAARLQHAREILGSCLIPVWRLYHHRRQQQAMALLKRSIGRYVLRRRTQRYQQATNCLLYLLSNPLAPVGPAVRRLAARAIVIQRAYRRHRLRIEACVTLNLLRLRKMEPRYWDRVVAKREAELAALDALAPSGLDTQVQTLSRQAEQATGRTIALPTATSGKRELDVYNFYLAGPLPESLLKGELRKAIYTDLDRVAGKAAFLQSVATPSKGKQARSPSAQTAHRRARVVVFLPPDIITAILDNTCFVASQFQGNPMLRSHLRGRDKKIVPY